jgi:class 3 adenylate cyclase
MRRTLTVILASDVAGYSRLVADREEETIRRFTQASSVFWDLVKKHQGTVFNTAGDAILARFDSAVDAVRCAIDIQDANNSENTQISDDQKLLFRIGIAIGDVLVSEDGDLLGDAVNVAARLENLADAGGICISDDVRSHVLNKIRLNVVDLGDQNLHNIPRAIRAFRVVVSQLQLIPAPDQGVIRRVIAGRRFSLIAAAIAAVAIAGLGMLGWLYYPWSRGTTVLVEEPFDPGKIPLVNDRVREALSNYEQEPDFKSIAIAGEGWGLAAGATDIEAAKREALDRCQRRDQKGYCRIYAIGNKVLWSRPTFPLPADIRMTLLDIPLTVELIRQMGSPMTNEQFALLQQARGSKGIALAQNGFYWIGAQARPAEAGRLAVERCSDSKQVPCLLVAIDGRATQRVPTTYQVTQTFTLAGEKEMTDADRERLGPIYSGKDWRALARGILPHWYAVNNMESETAAVNEVLKICRELEKVCILHAIGNFRVGKPLQN